MSKLSRQELIDALEKAEKNPRDRIGLLGEFGAVGLTGVGSAAIASTVLTTTTTTTMAAPLFGSVLLGKLLGTEVLVPIIKKPKAAALVVAGVVGVVAGHQLIKLIKSGVKSDKKIADYIKALKEKIEAYDKTVIDSTDKNTKISKLAGIYALLLKIEAINNENVETIFAGVENGSIDIDFALNNAKSMLDEIENNENNQQ